MRKVTLALMIFVLLPNISFPGEVDVTDVKFNRQGDRYRFDATLQHADTGWDHYTDRWDVLAPDGTILATRVLAHPHVNEQPFTRSLTGIKIPEEVTHVEVRGHDSVHAYGGKTITIDVK